MSSQRVAELPRIGTQQVEESVAAPEIVLGLFKGLAGDFQVGGIEARALGDSAEDLRHGISPFAVDEVLDESTRQGIGVPSGSRVVFERAPARQERPVGRTPAPR